VRIAAQLGISAGTVRNYLSAAILKLGAGNRIEAAQTGALREIALEAAQVARSIRTAVGGGDERYID
jgi:hypothetical protein